LPPLHPPLHPEVAISYANLGNAEDAKRNFAEALDWLQKAADIREQMPDTAATMLGLNYLQTGCVYFSNGDW
jgi:tetratricopeptide (TPR) repeat protein